MIAMGFIGKIPKDYARFAWNFRGGAGRLPDLQAAGRYGCAFEGGKRQTFTGKSTCGDILIMIKNPDETLENA